MTCSKCGKCVTDYDISLCQSVGFINVYCRSCFITGGKKLLQAVADRVKEHPVLDKRIKDGTFEQSDRLNVEEGE